MKTLIPRIAFVVVIPICSLLLSGCTSSQYAKNRRQDLADVFTIALGAGTGIQARVGPVQLAAINQADIVGLKAGCGFVDGENLHENEQTYHVFPRSAKINLGDEAVTEVFRTGKGNAMDLRGEESLLHMPMYQRRWYSAFGHELFDPGPSYSAENRRKTIAARSPFFGYTKLITENPAYYTQMELAVGVGLTLRLGFNPGELLDLLLGFASLDLYGDDL
ncbi:MAG: hypothetical protein OSB41_06700 [Kiritimatiellae bacterium]|nr:hypothetical protein [Kiritimatiellia bacterium]